MRSGDKSRKANFLTFGLAALGLVLFMRTSPLAADTVEQSQDSAVEDTEVIADLEFLESLEFLEEEVAMVDDYEALDKWEGEQNEQ
ncbi:MAG: hypothetical protein HZA28_01690 [Candidatus Omnitrophica bacterium]|nr:hypothetical protein [Candidatus Omnitrophota bacterium]